MILCEIKVGSSFRHLFVVRGMDLILPTFSNLRYDLFSFSKKEQLTTITLDDKLNKIRLNINRILNWYVSNLQRVNILPRKFFLKDQTDILPSAVHEKLKRIHINYVIVNICRHYNKILYIVSIFFKKRIMLPIGY